MPLPKLGPPGTLERTVAGLSYLTFGIAGVIYIIATGQKGLSDFFNFHFRQAIILSILCFLAGMATSALSSILAGTIGLINAQLASWVVSPMQLAAFIFDKVIYIVCLYGAIWAFLGKYAEIPLISSLVNKMR